MVVIDKRNKTIMVFCTNKDEFVKWLQSSECTKLSDKYKRFQIVMEEQV